MAFAPILSAAGTLISGVFGMAQGMYQAKVAQANADIAAENAKRAIERAQIEQIDQDTETLAMLGEQEAAQSASGISITGRSAVRTRATARRLGRRDALNVRQAGEIEAYNYLTDEMNFKAQAKGSQLSAWSSMVGGVLGAASDYTSTMSRAQGVSTASRYVPKPISRRTMYG